MQPRARETSGAWSKSGVSRWRTGNGAGELAQLVGHVEKKACGWGLQVSEKREIKIRFPIFKKWLR